MSGGALSAGTVSLGVKGDAKGFGAKVASDIKAQGSIFSDLGKHMGGLITAGLGAAGVAIGIGEILKTGIEEYSISDKLNAQFAAGIKSTGNAANLSVKSMDELAASIAGYSGQTYASIGQTEQVLQTFKDIKNVGPDKIFDNATTAAANMAAKLGGDASSNAVRLGRALEDPAKGVMALTRVGVVFSDQQKAQIKAMVASGDTMGAQKIILGELSTEFGGAAKAAGETLPGQLARSKVAFGELSKTVVSDVLPMVLPAVQWITDALTKATPWVEEFAKAFSEKLKAGVKAAQPFLSEIGDKVRDLGAWITGTALPAIKDLIKGFQDGTGPGGKIRDVVDGIWSVVKMLGEGIASIGIIGQIKDLAKGWQDSSGAGGALKDVAKDLLDGLSKVGTFLSGTLVPGIKDVVTWMGNNKDAVRDIAAVIGVVLLPVFADLAVKEVASGITSVTTWLTKSTAATTGAATELAAHYTVVAGWVASAAAAVASGAETVAIWAMYKLESLAGAATTVGGLLVVAGGWIATAATATASGIAMAAAWIIGLGPVGWIIGAIVAVGAAFVVLYNKVGWFRDGVNAAWHGILVGLSAAKDWIVNAWNNTIAFFEGIPGKVGAIFGGIGSVITAPFKAAFNGVAALWNNTVAGMSFTVPSWVPGLGGKGFSMPKMPTLAQGATILPTPGGTVVRVAEAGKAESVVDTGKLNNLLDKVGNGSPGQARPVDLSDGSVLALANAALTIAQGQSTGQARTADNTRTIQGRRW